MREHSMSPDRVVRLAGRYCNEEPSLRHEMLEYLGISKVSYLVILVERRNRRQVIDTTLVRSEEAAWIVAQHKAAESCEEGDGWTVFYIDRLSVSKLLDTSVDYPTNRSVLEALKPRQAVDVFNKYSYGMSLTVQQISLFQ